MGIDDGGDGVGGVVEALTNSKPSAIRSATPSSRNGRMVVGPPPATERSERIE
jgi:hypothetical protein